MTMITEFANTKLADMVKQVQAGNDVLLTVGDKPVARIVAARAEEAAGSMVLG